MYYTLYLCTRKNGFSFYYIYLGSIHVMIHVNNHIFTSKYASKSINFNKSQEYFDIFWVFYSSGSKGLYIFIVGPGRPAGWCWVGLVWLVLAMKFKVSFWHFWVFLTCLSLGEFLVLLFKMSGNSPFISAKNFKYELFI